MFTKYTGTGTKAPHKTVPVSVQIKIYPSMSDALIDACKQECEKLGEKTMSFVVLDASGKELAAGFVGSDQNKKAAVCKGNAVLVDGSDAKLANPAEKFGSCIGMCCVFCGCCWCD